MPKAISHFHCPRCHAEATAEVEVDGSTPPVIERILDYEFTCSCPERFDGPYFRIDAGDLAYDGRVELSDEEED
jgi:hypothetical protein